MKKLLLSILLVVNILVFAQVPANAPNAGMESWKSDFASEADPDFWITGNLARNPLINSANPISAIPELVSVMEGDTALKLVTVTLITNPSPDYIPWTGGVAFIGTIDLSMYPTVKVKPGFPVSSFVPTAFSYQGKYTPAGTDTAFAQAYLTHYNTTTLKSDTIAYALDTMYSTAAYDLRTVSFTYLPGFTGIEADTCMLNFSASCLSAPQEGSAYFVDDIQFALPTGISAPFASDGFMLYPNPTLDKLFIGGANRNAASAHVFRADGTLVKTKSLSTESYIETTGMAPGVYNVQIMDADGKVISSRKFSVSK